jgi:hypothetical protein
MGTTRIAPPASRVRCGLQRVDITPPVGIYHRLWGAARHDRATGVHRPVLAEVIAIAPLDGDDPALVRVQTDLCCLVQHQHDGLAAAVAAAAGVPRERVVIGYSHSHSSGWYVPDRISLPGGELIEPYLARLAMALAEAARQARAALAPATITYARGRCAMAANRDYWDAERHLYACGFNPDAPADDTLLLARITGDDGRLIATLVNYACHPTTLAWENSLISPDFAGAMRETVEAATGAPCVYFQGACGDLGPRHGFVGDTAVADRNGRELGYAALATLTAMGPAGTAFAYTGPVISGATLGVWAYQPLDDAELARQALVAGGAYTVDLPLRERPDPAALQAELVDWEARQRAADAAGDPSAARDYGARAERARRWLARIADVGPGPTYPFRFAVHRLGDAVWVSCGGEPYSLFQVELRRRFPHLAVLCSPLDGDMQVAYLLPADRYGRGLYQEEPSSLAPGCLERLIDAVAARITALTAT